jgi:S1-C subfamily serine protease
MTHWNPQVSFASHWHLLVPISLMGLLFLYLVFPGNIVKGADPTILAELAQKKAKLESQLSALKDLDNNSICYEDQLVIPKNNKSSLSPPTETTSLLTKLEQSVVLVLALYGEEEGTAWGSGFFISPSQIVTNGHVISDGNNRPKAIFVVNKHIGIQKVRVDTLRFNNDYSGDFAVLYINENLGSALPLAQITNPANEKLKLVYTAGFPGDVIESDEKFLRLMESDEFSVPDLVITDGIISSHQNVFGGVAAFVHTAQMSQGNSGGPLVNACGQVMGINTFINSTEDGIRNFSLTTSELSKYLKQNNLSPRIAAKECN